VKVYSISSPEQLNRAADLVKWDRDRRKVEEHVRAWQKGYGPKDVTLEMGRNAIIHYIADDGKKTKLATLYVIPAREFAREELTEI
jgi:hypothetical protein